jgi:large subunit ribosomal protein L25
MKKSELKAAKLNGDVPAIIYGKTIENIAIFVNGQSLLKTYHQYKGKNTIIKLQYEENGKEKNISVMSHDIDYDPLSHKIIHVDFVKLDERHTLLVNVPITVVGVSPGVKSGGVLIQNLNSFKIKALPNNIPNCVEIDISALNIGDVIKIKDIIEKIDYVVVNEPNEIIVQVQAAKKVRAEDEATAGGEAAAPEASGTK